MSSQYITNEKVKVSTNGKTTLPVQVRRFLEAHEGDEVRFRIDSEGTVTVDKVEDTQE